MSNKAMSSITEMKYKNQSPYMSYLDIKELYMTTGRGIGLELLEYYKFTHSYADIEVFTLYVLYGAFNEKIMQSLLDKRLQYGDVPAPVFSRTMIVDMLTMGYPVTKVISDIDRHHHSSIPIPFRERVIFHQVNQSGHFNESAISLLISEYAKST
jgi:hypothetical protein